MQPLSSTSFDQKVNNMINIFENRRENEVVTPIQQLVQDNNQLNIKPLGCLEELKNRLIQAHVEPNNVLIKQINEISKFLHGGPLAKLPKDILLKIFTTIDIKTIKEQTRTNLFFYHLLKDSQILLFVLNQIDVEERIKVAKRLGSLVKILNLNNLKMLDKKELQALVNACPNIRCLSLQACKKIGDQELDIIFKGFKKLQSLDLSHCSNITDEGLEAIVHLTDLQSLDLSYCYNITNNGLKSVARMLTNLRSLRLCCSNITDEELKSVIENLTELQTFDLCCCLNITDEGLKAIAHKLKKLQSLDLSYCNITDEGLKTIVHTLKGLKTLDLSYCTNITNKGIKVAENGLPTGLKCRISFLKEDFMNYSYLLS